MKKAPLLCLFLIGCEPSLPTSVKSNANIPVYKTTNQIRLGPSDEWGNLKIVVLDGHKFAIVELNGRCALCEVTDASLLKKEDK